MSNKKRIVWDVSDPAARMCICCGKKLKNCPKNDWWEKCEKCGAITVTHITKSGHVILTQWSDPKKNKS